jgi:hypothetical protein
MKSLVILLLLFLLIVGSAGAVANYRLSTTINFQELADVSCSQDTYPPSPNQTVIWVVFLSGSADVHINGDPKMPVQALTSGGKPGFQYYANPGMNTVDITRDGYSPYKAKVQACNGVVSYVYYDLTKQIITKAPTTTVTTTTTVVPTTTTQIQGGVTQVTPQQTLQATAAATDAAQPDMLGSVNVKTDPAGAFIFIDGVQRGVTTATIPGIPAGSHTILLKMDGYQDLSTPVIIAAGKTQDYSTSLAKNAADPTVTTVKKSASPGFGAVLGIAIIGAVLCMRKRRAE